MKVWTQLIMCKVSDAQRMSRSVCMGPVAVILSLISEKWNSYLIFTLCFYIVFVAFILPWTAEKMKFISYIYALFLPRFCSLLVEFWFKSCKHSGKETLQYGLFSYYVQQPSLWHNINRTLHRPINYCIYLWCCLRKNECHSCVYEPHRSKIGSSKEIVGECKYYKIKQLIPKMTISHTKYWWQFIMSAMKQANDAK